MSDPTLQVAQDLTAITDLAGHIAEHVDRVDCDAMAELGPVASPEAWQHQIDARDELARRAAEMGLPPDRFDTSHVADHDDGWEPCLQTLRYWSEDWRREHDRESDLTPTIASEVAFIRSCLEWAYEHEPRWEDFADDIHAARRRLEDELRAGERAERGVPCMYDECGGAVLSRRRWLDEPWRCPRCRREWDDDAYARMVYQAHLLHAEWLPVEDASARAVVPVGSVKAWAHRGHVRTRKDPSTGRTAYNVADVETRRDMQVAS